MVVIKKILYLCPNGYLGGAEKFVVNTCIDHLKRKNYEPIVIFFSLGPAMDILQAQGVKTILLPFSIKLKNIISVLKTVIFIRRIIRQHKILLVHFTMPYSVIVGWWATLFLNIKTVWFQHGPVGGWLDKIATIFPVDAILFNSKFLMKEHYKNYSFSRPRFGNYITGVGVEIGEEKNNLENNKLFFLWAGRIAKIKGTDILINAIGWIKKNYPELLDYCDFTIVGSPMSDRDLEYNQGLEQLIIKQGLTNLIRRQSFSLNLSSYYKKADIVIHTTTINEAFGLVVAEAMSYDCLVIGSANGGSGELLKNGETGISFNPSLPDSFIVLAKILTKCITDFRKNPNKALLFKQERIFARRFIIENFASEKVTEKIENLYKRICNNLGFTKAHPLYYIDSKLEQVLDVGCNTGALLFDLYQMGAEKLFGIEINENALLKAKKRLECCKDCKLVQGSADEIAISDKSINIVTCCEVLEHVPYELRRKVIFEISRVLKDDGQFILTVPYAGIFSFLDPANWRLMFPSIFKIIGSLFGGIGREAGFIGQKHGIVWHHHFCYKEILNLLNTNGLKIDIFRGRGCFLAPIMNWLEFPFYRLEKTNTLIFKFIRFLHDVDMSINYGRFLSYNVIVVASKKN